MILDETTTRRFAPGRNCWRVDRAERLYCVQDAAEYFRLVRNALLAAQRSVFILGWDIAAGLNLVPGGVDDGAPSELAPLLDHIARRKRGLHCHVLIWDYAAFYAIERDPFSLLRLGTRTHRRVHFDFDDHHPLSASHHQKVVVIDDRLAFIGGIDLTHHRWDTRDHAVENPLRRNALGSAYGPYHELQWMVEGPAAASLGLLARRRWQQSGRRRRLPAIATSTQSLWPTEIAPDFEDLDVALARTEPAFAGRPAVREVETLFEDMISAARHSIYVENQYFTNVRLAKAMGERLREPDGPEIVIVGPQQCEGWLERSTMGALRARVIEQLLAADLHGRLRLVYPLASQSAGVCTFVHSKAMIVDDEWLRIGSANLSHRSMGFDTECDLAVDAAGDERLRAGIRGVRARLLAEHLGVTPEQVESVIEETGQLTEVLTRLSQGDRRLCELEHLPVDTAASDMLADAADPSEPMAVSQVVDRLLPEIEAADGRNRVVTWMLPALVVTACLVAGWRAFDQAQARSALGLQALLFDSLPTLPIAGFALAGFVVAGLLCVPLEALVLATVVGFGFLRGSSLALLGVAIVSTAGYLLGRAIGASRLVRWVDRRGRRVWRRLTEGGTMTVAVLRAVPVTPATIVHLLCGGARVPIADYAKGTLLGLAPICSALIVVGLLLRRALREPTLVSVALAVTAALALALFMRRVRTSLIASRLSPRTRPIEGHDDFG